MIMKVALFALVLVVIASGLCGCIDQTGPEIPAKDEMPGYSQGWSDGKQRGFTTGYVAYLRSYNLSEAQVNYDVELTPKAEQLQGYSLGEQQGYNAAWGYGFDSAMSVYEPVKWDEMGYIVPGNETAADFYAGLGYDITKYKSKATNSTAVTYGKEADGYINYKDCIYDVTATGEQRMNKAQLVDSIAKEAKRDPELTEVVEVEVRTVKFKAGSDLATKVR